MDVFRLTTDTAFKTNFESSRRPNHRAGSDTLANKTVPIEKTLKPRWRWMDQLHLCGAVLQKTKSWNKMSHTYHATAFSCATATRKFSSFYHPKKRILTNNVLNNKNYLLLLLILLFVFLAPYFHSSRLHTLESM